MQQTVQETKLSGGLHLRLIHGDLTQSQAEALFNAANEQLAHGGGVAAALARAGGPTIQRESNHWVNAHGPIDHQHPALTGAGDLAASAIIHVVGPRWGEGEEAHKLAAAIRSGLELADEQGFSTVAMPPVSTGIFGYPKAAAASVILETVRSFAEAHPVTPLQRVDLVIIDEATLDPFQRVFRQTFLTSAKP